MSDGGATPRPGAAGEREARWGVSSGQGAALPRVMLTYRAARALLGFALLLAPFAATLGGTRTPLVVLLVSLAYAGQAVAMWVWRHAQADGLPAGTQPPLRVRQREWLWTVGVDTGAFALLRMLDPAGPFNYAALLVLPVLMAGVVMPRKSALAVTAAVVLLLLGSTLAAAQSEMVLQVSQSGLAGAGLFMITLLANELATRLAGEEHSARTSQALAAQQTLLNRLVIAEMTEGVLVIDRGLVLRSLNPAARLLLALPPQVDTPLPLTALPGAEPLVRALQRAQVQGSWPEDARELTLTGGDGQRQTLLVRARFTRRDGIGGEAEALQGVCVVFLEDLRSVQARARQDKLAEMGRMSAGIAHEIRNPLAAIAQANALQLEDELSPAQRRLAGIVGDNVERLKRIVDDVLAVATMPAAQPLALDFCDVVPRICSDWVAACDPAAQADRRLQIQLPAGRLAGYFDSEHLRRVLVNLLDNALRHAGPGDGAVQVWLAPMTSHALTVSVASDGPSIDAETERHLFEPFFSSRSRGSGLGLYICRELCARHGATIDYLPGPTGARHRNVFRLTARRVRGGRAAAHP